MNDMTASSPFVLSDGTELNSLTDLKVALAKMPQDEFDKFVNDEKNDFCSWFDSALNHKSLCTAATKIRSKKELQALVENFLEKGHHVYETIIIGSGIAGISAAVYAARKRMHFLIIGEEFGGQVNVAGEIENFPTISKTSWDDFGKRLKDQLDFNGVKIREETVEKVEKKDDGHFLVKTNKAEYEAQTVILCSGARARRLNIPGEDKFEKKGVTYCAICDGPLFPDKDVAIIGGGDAALEAAEFMLRIAKKIYLISIGEIGGYEYLRERVLNQPKIEVLTHTKTLEISGDKFVTGITVSKDGEEKKLDVQAVFVEIGRIPNTEMVKGLVKMDKHEHIVVDKFMMTSVPGIYAAGDCIDLHSYQFVTSAGQAVTALLMAAISKEKQ